MGCGVEGESSEEVGTRWSFYGDGQNREGLVCGDEGEGRP